MGFYIRVPYFRKPPHGTSNHFKPEVGALGFRAFRLYRVWERLGFRALALGFRALGLGFRALGLGFRVLGLGLWVEDPKPLSPTPRSTQKYIKIRSRVSEPALSAVALDEERRRRRRIE